MITFIALLLAQGATATPLERVPPQYPAMGAQFGVTATCPIIFDLDENGSPQNICATCYTSAPDYLPQSTRDYVASEFAAASVEAIRQWRYSSDSDRTSGIETNMDFMLEDDDGTVINPPEPGPNSNCRQPDIG